MVIDFSHHEHFHHLGDSATHPIEPRWRTLAALLVVASSSLLPPHALPTHVIAAHSGAFN